MSQLLLLDNNEILWTANEDLKSSTSQMFLLRKIPVISYISPLKFQKKTSTIFQSLLLNSNEILLRANRDLKLKPPASQKFLLRKSHHHLTCINCCSSTVMRFHGEQMETCDRQLFRCFSEEKDHSNLLQSFKRDLNNVSD